MLEHQAIQHVLESLGLCVYSVHPALLAGEYLAELDPAPTSTLRPMLLDADLLLVAWDEDGRCLIRDVGYVAERVIHQNPLPVSNHASTPIRGDFVRRFTKDIA